MDIGSFPWWAALYGAVYLVVSIVAAKHDRARGDAWYLVGSDLLASVVLVGFFASYWHAAVIAPLGRASITVLAACLISDVFSAKRDIADLQPDPELSPTQNAAAEWLGVAITAVLTAPMYAVAAFSVARQWKEVV